MIELDGMPPGRSSVFGDELGRWLEGRPFRCSLDVAEPGSGGGHVLGALGHGRVAGDEGLPASVVSFAGLLEAGAQRLAAARAAHVRQGQEAAVLARELAAFAAARPSSVLDRPAAEVGAAAAAARAARPAALTAVSEWAVDEVMWPWGCRRRVEVLRRDVLSEAVLRAAAHRCYGRGSHHGLDSARRSPEVGDLRAPVLRASAWVRRARPCRRGCTRCRR